MIPFSTMSNMPLLTPDMARCLLGKHREDARAAQASSPCGIYMCPESMTAWFDTAKNVSPSSNWTLSSKARQSYLEIQTAALWRVRLDSEKGAYSVLKTRCRTKKNRYLTTSVAAGRFVVSILCRAANRSLNPLNSFVQELASGQERIRNPEKHQPSVVLTKFRNMAALSSSRTILVIGHIHSSRNAHPRLRKRRKGPAVSAL